MTKIWLCLPSEDQQEKIVKYLDCVTKSIDDVVSTATAAITLLQERRSAVITAAVTGKIDVRDFTPAEAA